MRIKKRVEFVQIENSLSECLLELAKEEALLVIEAKSAQQLDLASLVKTFEKHKGSAFRPSAAIAVKAPSDEISGIRTRSEKGILCEFYDEFSTAQDYNGIFTGCAVLSEHLLEAAAQKKLESLNEIISFSLSEADEILSNFDSGLFLSLHTPEAYRKAALKLLDEGIVSDTAVKLSDGIYAEEELSLSGITLIAPVYVGKGVRFEKGCVVENSIIEANVSIGARSELYGCIVSESAVIEASASAKGSVICAKAVVSSAARLFENCVVGEKSIVGAGCEVESNVKIPSSKHMLDGEIVSEASNIMLDDECCCIALNPQLSPSECARIGHAVGSALERGNCIVCGCGEEEASFALLKAFESGAAASGVTVMSIGRALRQHVMYLVNRLGADMGCCVNIGSSKQILLMEKGGLPLNGKIRSAIERCGALGRYRTEAYDSFGKQLKLEDSKELYEIFLEQHLPKTFHGVNADVRCANPEYARLADRLVRSRNDTDGEQMIFHISSDGVTCTAYTERTGYVVNERLVLLAVKAAFEKNIPVSLPFTFPLAADRIAEERSGKLYRYFNSPLDSSDEAARKVASRPDNFFVRDAFVLMCSICAYLSEKGLNLAEATTDIPKFYSSQRFAAVEASANDIYQRLECKREGGEGIVMSGIDSRAMVRPLRHRRGIVIFAESTKAETAASLCDEIIERLKKSSD